MQAPTIVLSAVDISADTGPSASDFITSAQAQTVTATLSAALAADDLLLGSLDAGTTWSDITSKVSGTSLAWTGATLLAGSGRGLVFKVRDATGNDSALTGSQAYTLDATAPTVVITDDEPANTADVTGGDIVYTFTFSEAVAGFDAGDVNLSGGAKGAFTAVSATVYTLVVTPTANVKGDVTVSVGTGAAADAAGNASVAAAASPQAVDMRTSPFQGTSGNDNLEGTLGAEVIAGGAGDDYIDGNGGADVMYGGTGNDRFLLDANQIASLSVQGTSALIDGGAGMDVLELWGSNVALDFTLIEAGVVRDIEKIHMGTAGGPLKITATDVLGLSGMHWDVDGNPSTVDALGQLMVSGDGTHGVQLADSGWAQTGTYTESGTTYQVWTDAQDRAQLLLGPNVSVLS
jgi:Ca2+-binding RTX toxin-like protein